MSKITIPGKILLSILNENNLTLTDFAERQTTFTNTELADIVTGRLYIDEPLAERIEKATKYLRGHLSKVQWLGIQYAYDQCVNAANP